MKRTINVIGLGYIGLPTSLMLSSCGVNVIGTDYNTELVKNLQNKILTFEEKDLDKLFELAINSGIKFTTEYISTDFYIIAVATPYDKLTKKIDTFYVITALEAVLKKCKIGSIIVIESTIAPGTIDNHIKPIVEKNGFRVGIDIHIVHAPERIIPGNMIFELANNSRTIGTDNKEIGEVVKKIYSKFCKSEIVITDIKTAEMSKIVENTFRDINIAFANELAKICREGGMDIYEVIKVANMHPRVNILQPGPGVGGHCISVDPWFLVGEYPELAKLILNARLVNDSMPFHLLKRIQQVMEKNGISDFAKVGLYGLTYKEDVDDTRESPTLQLINILDDNNIHSYKVYDPLITKKIVNQQIMDFNEFLIDIELLVIMVGHNHIKDKIHLLVSKQILDTKNIMKMNFTHKL